MRIDNAQLAAFAAVLSEGTFDSAARKLNVTPSAVSQRIKLLEDRMGQVLIQRATPCQATSAGRSLLRFAEQLALLEAEVFSELGVADAIAPSTVRIPVVVNADSLDSWFSEVFDGLPDAAAITLDIRSEDQDHSVALLREGTVMAAVSANALPIQGCQVEPLGVMRYLAVASPSFVDRHFPSGVNADTLHAAPMLMFNKKDALQRAFVSQFTELAVRPPTHFVPSTPSFLEAARRGLAWGMMPEQIVSAALQAAELVEIAPDHWLDVPLFWHRWGVSSSTLEVIGMLVRAAARRALRQPTR
ncbi:LysR family transcriptional regulator ArgP [Accumulibacter sp.]|uniref:LysR family transcriptional regulator ArgP n=1 Tax=Accumulibacter sp. TaxID=2053492 RepID=UPI00260509A6|nr:LysR family transcriptional regulator ArgP [Accumulibacter sp.]